MIAFALTATAAATVGLLVGALCCAAKHADQPFLLPGTWIVDVDPNGDIASAERRIDTPIDWDEIVRRAHGE